MKEGLQTRESRDAFVLRDAVPDDAAAIEQILYEATREAYPKFVADITAEKIDETYRRRDLSKSEAVIAYRKQIESGMPESKHWLVAEQLGEVQGFVCFDSDLNMGGRRYVVSLYVNPDSQNQGIGTQLLHKSLEELDASDNDVYINVVEGNPAVETYKKFGFQVERHVPKEELDPKMYHPFDILEMRRPASPL